ncbi:MAG: 30S ribosomal protein S4 [Terriglobus roseus]|nr:30S ribosomal protein S4 [Terriglobus roseus]
MARYTGAVCRLCRRDGVKLFLKGSRCFSEKCAIDKRNFPPGQHGQARAKKIVGYGLQLREKQKAKRIYFTLEGQFREYYEKANQKTGVTGELLLQQLERRLDNVAYRLGFAISRRQARQVVRHGHVQVNGKKVNIPSYQVKVGDVIEIREKAKKMEILAAGEQFAAGMQQPMWLQIDREALSGKVVALPKREEIQLPVNEQLIVELYSK